MRRSLLLAVGSVLLALDLAACKSDSPGPAQPDTTSTLPLALKTDGQGQVADRYTAEVWVQGSTAYTTTWGTRGPKFGNAIYIWDVSGLTPKFVDTLIVENATTLGDVQASDDGRLLVVATERINGAIVIYDITNPRAPQRITRYQTAETTPGVHTATLARVNGKLYAFLCIDPSPVKLMIVDLSDPANPSTVWSKEMGRPFVHDVFVRDGLLFTALWNDGLTIWDIGGGNAGGSITNPVQLGNLITFGGSAHNIWWFQDPVTGSKKYAFVGEEGSPAIIGQSSTGDIHVVDVSDLRNLKEVAFFHVDGAGTHNFSVDEPNGILYAAYYNAGVRALDVRGDLSNCAASMKASDGRCNLNLMGREIGRGLQTEAPVYVWGVQFTGQFLYASDMLNGLWKLGIASR